MPPGNLFESRIYLIQVSSISWLSSSPKIGLLQRSVLINTFSGNSANCGEMLLKSFKIGLSRLRKVFPD